MMTVDIAENAMVAGANAGAGADEVVCVREMADRDLSKKSAIA